MPYAITPSLGADLSYVGPKPYYDGNSPSATPKLGTKVVGDDGRDYLFVLAGGNIAASTQIAISSDFEATTGGTTGYFTQGDAVVSGDYFWARKTAL